MKGHRKLVRLIGALVLIVCLAILASGCGKNAGKREVVVYTSVDQIFSEPILKDFEQKTGIKVLPVYDVETAKTTGLVNRLIAEKDKPQADVFWSSEFVQTILLKEKGVLAPYKPQAAQDLPGEYLDEDGYWTAFGGRARVLLVNTDLVPASDYPDSIFDLEDAKWPASKAGMAYPMFGTSATHAAALYAALGEEKARAFYDHLKQRGIRVVDGNSVVRDMVASGELIWGLTDTDDAYGALQKGAHVVMIFPDQEDMGTLVVPNTVALIKGSRHPKEAKELLEYLVSREVEGKLVASGFIQIPCRQMARMPAGLPEGGIKRMEVTFDDIYASLEPTKRDMAEIFVR